MLGTRYLDAGEVNDEWHEVLTSKNHKVTLDDIQVPVQSNVAAGIPVLELVKRYEEENILSRQDRMTFYEAYKDPRRREILIQALSDVEVGTNPRFSVQRLKAHIHQNPGGLPNGKVHIPQALHSRHNKQTPSLLRPELDVPMTKNLINLPKLEDNSGDNRINQNNTSGNDTVTVLPLSTNALNSMIPVINKSQKPMLEKLESVRVLPSPIALKSSPSRHSSKSMSTARTSLSKRSSPGSKLSKNASISTDDNTFSVVKSDIQEAISDLVGEAPAYKHTYNVCQKMEERLAEYLVVQARKKTRHRPKLGVIIGSGSCNPLTRMHMRRFYLAKQYLESRSDLFVLGSLVSPAHHTVVRERYRNYLQEIMPSPHRLAIAGMMVSDSKWLSVDPWEATRKRAMDTLSLCEHLREIVQNHTYSSPGSSSLKSAAYSNMKDFDVKIFYLCKPGLIPMLSPVAMKQNNFHVLCVCRPPESDELRASLGSKWNGVLSVVEDDAILDCSMDIITSKEVREKIKKGTNVAHLMGGVAEEYLQFHNIGNKMNGEAAWTREEIKLPKMKCTYGHIKHSHVKYDADGNVINTAVCNFRTTSGHHGNSNIHLDSDYGGNSNSTMINSPVYKKAKSEKIQMDIISPTTGPGSGGRMTGRDRSLVLPPI